MSEESKTEAAVRTPNAEKLYGVFSTKSIFKVGTGVTTRKTIQKSYWFIEENAEGNIDVQPLNKHYIPAGQKKTITKDDLLQNFSPEPEFYISTVFPKMRELGKTIARADRHRSRGETFSAEMEYGNALKVDEENVRANFGIGLCYLERGETAKADDIFGRLVKLDATFEPEHKHLFNDFGISLRKNKMLKQALEYYDKALQISPDDENLYYNIARAYYELGKIDKVRESLQKALQLNPNLAEAKKFMNHLADK